MIRQAIASLLFYYIDYEQKLGQTDHEEIQDHGQAKTRLPPHMLALAFNGYEI